MVDTPAFPVDTHAHVFERSLALVPGRRYAPGADALLPDYLAHLDRHGLRAGVLVQPSFLGTDNSYMLQAIRSAPERLRGVAVVDENIEPAALLALARGGIVGIRLNLVGQPLPVLDRGNWPGLLAQLRELDWHVEVHVEAERLAKVVPTLRAAGCQVVIDHFGRPDNALGINDPGFRWLLQAARDEGVWVKISAAYRNWPDPAGAQARDAVHLLLEHAGAERLLWGSDWPHTQHPDIDYETTWRAFLLWFDDPKLREQVLSGNARRCFDF